MWKLHPIRRVVQLNGFYTAFEAKLDANYVFRGETHDFYEIVLILSGSLGVTAGARSFILEAPAAVLHPPMEFHALRAERGTQPELMVFSFDASSMPDYGQHIFTLSEANRRRAEAVLSLLHDSDAMADPTEGASGADKEKAAQRALMEMESLLLTLSESDLSHHEITESKGDRNYRRVLQMIEEHLTLPLDTADLAQLAHMSPSLLKKLFARYAGVGVMEYVRTRKINAAIPYLRSGCSVQEVAARFGFSTPGYFATVFRRITGKAPSYYHNH